jgi:hypothetical protein
MGSRAKLSGGEARGKDICPMMGGIFIVLNQCDKEVNLRKS